jgi:glycine oxidase
MTQREPDLWTDARPERAALTIVGGGPVGLACAWRAARAGIATVVIDAPARPAAAEVAAGMVAPAGEAAWGEETLLAAARDAAGRWPRFAEELAAASGREVPLRRCGALQLALDRDEAAELRRRSRLQGELGLATRALPPSEARELEPALSPNVAAAVEAPGEAEVDPRQLLGALTAAAAAAGATLVRGLVERVDPRTGTLTLGDGELRAERVLLAAGAWSGAGLLPEELRLPVRPVAGEVVRLRAAAGELPCERILAGERFYVVPRRSGEVVVGATVEERGFDLRVTAGGVHELLRESYRALPELAELELVEASAGLRPGTPDNAPLVGRHGGERLLVATGMYRSGILLVPSVAVAIEALLDGREVPEALAPLSPARLRREVAA